MKHLAPIVLAFALSFLFVAPRALAADSSATPDTIQSTPLAEKTAAPDQGTLAPPGGCTWHSIFNGRLTLGTRMTYFTLVDAPSSNYLGTIDKLDEQQDLIPWKFFALWQFNPHWGVEFTWDQLEAKTVTRTADLHSDGSFKIEGPIFDAVYQLHKYGRFTPYAQLGLAWMMGEFEPAPWWALGYGSKADWLACGSPGKSYKGRRRHIELDDALGLVAAAGTRIEIAKHWSGDLFLRYMYVENDANYTEKISKRIEHDEDGTIPLSNLALGAGVSYAF